jgi:predicted dehydrogenase
MSAFEPMRLGMIGTGRFGHFCLEEYRSLPEVRAVGAADVNPDLARRVADEQGIRAFATVAELLDSPDIELVHIATPPSTHHELVMHALRNGKHVLCEKPLATTMAHAEEMAALAREKGLVLAVNLIMRYNPLCELVQAVLKENILGAALHATLENYATDEPLPPTHWFWKPEISGSIFIEHGVHFFDLFRMWFGEGRVVAAQRTMRPGTPFVEQVNCTAIHGANVIANFYHGFHQAERMDRQEFTIVCEMGDIRLYEWVPTRITIHALLTASQLDRLRQLVPNVHIEEAASYQGGYRTFTCRHREREADGRYWVEGNNGLPKMELYGVVLRALMKDQVTAARTPSHTRRVTEENGVTSLRMATDAERLAGSP